MNLDTDTDFHSVTIQATDGRDTGKAFRVQEVPPFDMASYVLRLLSALRLGEQVELMDLLRPSEDADQTIESTLKVLSGCDPDAVKQLVADILDHVQVAPDPKHPGAYRALNVRSDIRELVTLKQILGAFVKLHFHR